MILVKQDVCLHFLITRIKTNNLTFYLYSPKRTCQFKTLYVPDRIGEEDRGGCQKITRKEKLVNDTWFSGSRTLISHNYNCCIKVKIVTLLVYNK